MEYYSAIKEETLAICDNSNETGGHYAKWSKLDTEQQITSYMESKTVKHTEGESRTMISRDGFEEGRGESVKSFINARWMSSGGLIQYSMVMRVNNTVLYTWYLLRE